MTHSENHQPTSVVLLGGAGKTGTRVAERLSSRGIASRAASRSTPIRFDWDDATTWPGALTGADAAYVTFQPDLAAPGAAETVAAVAALAAEIGIQRLVLLSGRGEEGAQESERAVLAAHPRASVARCAWFAQNFSEGMLADAVRGGVVALPVPATVVEPFVDLDDVADVVVAALTDPGHEGRVYELTGPSALTFPQAADVLSSHVGREVRFVSVADAEFVAEAVRAGLDEPSASFLAELFGEITDGRNEHLSLGVREALGRPATSFEAFAAKAFRSVPVARAS